MEKFKLLAEPWWVNLLFLFPFAAYFFWKESLRLTKKILIIAFIFGAAFGFVEAAVVIYLRAAVRWPNSFIAPDVLFLIPVPWYSQVWFPILISGLTMLVIIMRISKKV